MVGELDEASSLGKVGTVSYLWEKNKQNTTAPVASVVYSIVLKNKDDIIFS